MNEYEHLKKQKAAIKKKQERKELMNVLSKMHDQYCFCVGSQPEGLKITPHQSSILGWHEGDNTPYYCSVSDSESIQTLFHGIIQ